jgi:hypothetical protein
MTLPTKILLALVIVVGGSAVAYADVAADEKAVQDFTPAPTVAVVKASDQSALTVRDEIADDQTEGGSCQINCHPAFAVNLKTALAPIDLSKIK